MDHDEIPFSQLPVQRERSEEILRITWVGLGINLVLSAGKIICGWLGKSQAILADGVHSLSDLSTDLAILIGARYWSRPADECHPHGHQRIEAVVTVGIAFILAMVAVGIGYHAIATYAMPHAEAPRWIAFVAACCSIVTKEILYQWTMAVAKRIRSSALIANAWHHRSDAWSSIPAAAAVLGTKISPQWTFLDHIGAVIVSLFILQASWKVAAPAILELTDIGASREKQNLILALAKTIPGISCVHALRSRWSGPGLRIDLHLSVPGTLSVEEGHAISERVKELLLAEGPDVADVIVHLEPCPCSHAASCPYGFTPSSQTHHPNPS